MNLLEEVRLRRYIRSILSESGWEDPDVVMFKLNYVEDSDVDEDDESNDDSKESQYKINKTVDTNQELSQRDNYSRANTSMASMKPLAPKQGGGPQSGRQPGGTKVSPSRSYSAGY